MQATDHEQLRTTSGGHFSTIEVSIEKTGDEETGPWLVSLGVTANPQGEGHFGWAYLTPTEARKVANLLLRGAAHADLAETENG